MTQDTSSYVGIDIAGAGQGSESGVVVINRAANGTTYHLPEGDWRGPTGLRALADLARGSVHAAVDQPFSYPRETTNLLLGHEDATGEADVTAYCSRQTDVAMRRLLSGLGLSTNYVMSPNRCQNIWRALALARLVGLSRSEVCLCRSKVIETHPRVVWAHLLSARSATLDQVIRGYKGTDNPEAEAEFRRQMLDTFERVTSILPRGSKTEQVGTRARMCDSSDAIEALVCAYVAYLHADGETNLCGFPDGVEEAILCLEGAAVLPKRPWPLNTKD